MEFFLIKEKEPTPFVDVSPIFSLFTLHYSLAKRSERLVFVKICTTVSTRATARVDHEARSLSGHCEATGIHALALGQLDLRTIDSCGRCLTLSRCDADLHLVVLIEV